MRTSSLRVRWLAAALLACGCLGNGAARADEQKIVLCHAGLVTLQSFAEHLKVLRSMSRYEKDFIDQLIAAQRKGGPDFFTSQIVVQEEQSGSGTFDLRIVHGIANAVKYRNVTAWTCEHDDFPIAYFIGFRVRRIENGAIQVTREKDVVNVISLKTLDPKLDKGIKVTVFEGSKVLCEDIGKSCIEAIFYSRE
jgi:hypothetical protein